MFTITAERARYYAGRDYVDNLVEIDLASCLNAIIRDSGRGYRDTNVEAPTKRSGWMTDPERCNERRIERVIDELRDRGFCIVYRYNSGKEMRDHDNHTLLGDYYYHIEW